jgi:2,3-bisphosphoglycerate-independent phosphoglycerate mutase
VNTAIEDGSFYEIAALVAAVERARERGADLHLLGLASNGGVHSHIDHLHAVLELARRHGLGERTWVHAFTDGRDVSPHAAVTDLAELPADRIATLSGRYYAMDRDGRWDRTERAFSAIVEGEGRPAADPIAAVQQSYDEGVTDEFLEPVALEGRPRLGTGDEAIFFNFRPDRARQLSRLLLDRGFPLTTMTRYQDDFDAPVAFEEQEVDATLAEVLAGHGARQLHAAETEKYAHVTYFFNGGREEEWPGETRILVPSPRDVPSYDQRPAMSAHPLTDRVCNELDGDYTFAVVNFANPDMVGHTGLIPAVVEAVEAVDGCLGRVVDRVLELGGACLVTADHGNAEVMLEPDGTSPHTAHTTSPVPSILTASGLALRGGGELSDVAPTVLSLLGLDPPMQMSGKDLVRRI